MNKIYILTSISLLIVLGFLTIPTQAQACNNYAFDSDCQSSYYQGQFSNNSYGYNNQYSNSYGFNNQYYGNNNDYNNQYSRNYGYNNQNNYRSRSRYRFGYAFESNNYRNHYIKYAFYQHPY